MTTWVVVADASRARIFESRRHGNELVECDTLVHPSSRMKTKDLMSDGPGQTRDRFGQAQRNMDPRTSAHHVEEEKFALEVAEFLNRHNNDHDFDELIVAAPPAFLGSLRQRCDKQVDKRISRTVSKNYTTLSPEELVERLTQPLH